MVVRVFSVSSGSTGRVSEFPTALFQMATDAVEARILWINIWTTIVLGYLEESSSASPPAPAFNILWNVPRERPHSAVITLRCSFARLQREKRCHRISIFNSDFCHIRPVARRLLFSRSRSKVKWLLCGVECEQNHLLFGHSPLNSVDSQILKSGFEKKYDWSQILQGLSSFLSAASGTRVAAVRSSMGSKEDQERPAMGAICASALWLHILSWPLVLPLDARPLFHPRAAVAPRVILAWRVWPRLLLVFSFVFNLCMRVCYIRAVCGLKAIL